MEAKKVQGPMLFNLEGLTEQEVLVILGALDYPDWSANGEIGDVASGLYMKIAKGTGIWGAGGDVFPALKTSFGE